MVQYKIIHVLSGLAIACFYTNVRLFENFDPPVTYELFELIESGNADDSFYICNVQHGTCLGTLHIVSFYEPVVAENRKDATGRQLLWTYNETVQKFISFENRFVAMDVLHDAPPYDVLQYYEIREGDFQKFTLELITTEE